MNMLLLQISVCYTTQKHKLFSPSLLHTSSSSMSHTADTILLFYLCVSIKTYFLNQETTILLREGMMNGISNSSVAIVVGHEIIRTSHAHIDFSSIYLIVAVRVSKLLARIMVALSM